MTLTNIAHSSLQRRYTSLKFLELSTRDNILFVCVWSISLCMQEQTNQFIPISVNNLQNRTARSHRSQPHREDAASVQPSNPPAKSDPTKAGRIQGLLPRTESPRRAHHADVADKGASLEAKSSRAAARTCANAHSAPPCARGSRATSSTPAP